MKYQFKAPPSKTEQTLSFEIPDLPATLIPVISGTTPIDPTPPGNQLPVVNAGNDVTITLPLSQVNFSGIASDPDGSIASYLWTKVSGGAANIGSPNNATTLITGLLAGSYTFRLTVIDNSGATKSDDTLITVKPAVPVTPSTFSGYGSKATGGTGKPVFNVTNLNSTGAGSLANAIGSNRIITFGVSGTIKNFISKNTNIQNLTIDGTTAPSVGITLINSGDGDCLEFERSSNIIIKNIRIRGAGTDGDCLAFNDGCSNIMIDHVSVSGGRDGNLDLTESSNITVQNSIIGTGGNNGTSDKWSGAMLLAYDPAKNISILYNLFEAVTAGGVGERIPLVSHSPSGAFLADIRNNLMWLWGRAGGTGSGYATGVSDGAGANVVNNYYYSKAAQTSATVNKADPNLPAGKMYAAGNVSGNGVNANAGNNHSEFAVDSYAQIPNEDALTTAKRILLNAGCQPLDSTDIAYINSVSL